MKIARIGEQRYLLTSHDSENSCNMISANPKIGFYDRERIDTENHKVFSACLLNSGIPGVSMKVEDEAAQAA